MSVLYQLNSTLAIYRLKHFGTNTNIVVEKALGNYSSKWTEPFCLDFKQFTKGAWYTKAYVKHQWNRTKHAKILFLAKSKLISIELWVLGTSIHRFIARRKAPGESSCCCCATSNYEVQHMNNTEYFVSKNNTENKTTRKQNNLQELLWGSSIWTTGLKASIKMIAQTAEKT